VPAKIEKDAYGTTYTVPAAPGHKSLMGRAEVHVWWARLFKDKKDETLLIRQENATDRADVIELTFGQLYDLIDALNKAAENT
jgi:hypothetical protein